MLSDQPIKTAKNDLLGRKRFARQIASAMRSCPAKRKGSFVFGLYGGWGSGKTSILNMTAEALAARKTAGKTPIMIRFNPWQYPSAEMLPGQFLYTLAAELEKPANGKKLRKAGKAVRKYAAALQSKSPSDKSTVTTETVAELTGKAAKKRKKKQKPPKDVLLKKAKVCKRLKKQKRNIYVMMDDIDRLSAGRIRYALQMVNAIADFPRMVYLLALNPEVVADALSKELNTDGYEYLRKFVQAQYAVPAPPAGRMQAILNAYFDTWRQEKTDLNLDSAYFEEIKPFLFAHITEIRDVYRFINTFRFQYQALGDEVNFADLAAITALQLHVPQVLPWMLTHRDDLLRGGGLAYSSANSAEKQRLRREHRRMITALGGSGDKTLLPLIGHMFPRYGANVLDIYDEETDLRYVRMRRICCEEFFDLYFTLSPETLTITRQEMMRSVRTMDAAALRAFTESMNGRRRIAYITQLPHYLEDIEAAKLPIFFFETLRFSRLPEEKTPSDKPFQRSFFQECCYTAMRMLAAMDADTQSQCLAQAVANADESTLPAMVVLVERIAGRNPDAEPICIGDDVLKTYTGQLLQKIETYAHDGNWLTTAQPLPVLEFWKRTDESAFLAYFYKLMQDDCNMARLISWLIRRFDRGANMEYQYGDMNGKHAFSNDFVRSDALAAIRRLRNTPAFAALPKDVRLDCVAFSLMDEQITRVKHKVVLDAYPSWDNR